GGCRASRAPQARSARRMGRPDRDSGMTLAVRWYDLVAPVYDPCTGSLPWAGGEEAGRSLDLRAPFLGAAPKAGGEVRGEGRRHLRRLDRGGVTAFSAATSPAGRRR